MKAHCPTPRETSSSSSVTVSRNRVVFHVKHSDKPCSGHCGQTRDLAYSRYCRACRNARARATRPRYGELSAEARLRANCRSHTKTLQARGTLPMGPCEGCGNPNAENHHPNYHYPQWFVRLCSVCHAFAADPTPGAGPVEMPARVRVEPPRKHTVSRGRCGAEGCRHPARPGQRYCRACHAAAQKAYRERQKLTRRSAAWGRTTHRLTAETTAWSDPYDE